MFQHVANSAKSPYTLPSKYLRGKIVRIIPEKCKKCLTCIEVCPVRAISEKDGKVTIDKDECLGCGCCAASCPNAAIEYE
ncbi:MAG: 4Fe-4S binding protein [Holosporaceae bacterium]|nr:4Fe-4S binding protein [Holosporaceae bacterium]